ncbi:hypothetical protein A5714_15960 [Mycobacterium sp. E2462]|uniref:hypothetical protein n=1 Tax=unclassified Mycobacterium TaxID=2642494 RepID=UPI0007FD0908|nr:MULTISPECIES: hypothetical protein [unclassified Mycobacterium]OBG76458.1 hypothetical protein A5700_21885 [Mycobacterium sp. E1214]OBH25595.1 hypothetical protein A5693_05930 [Mycobacterium sp. E1319]OBI11822.1 hypothetical protein A5714_15960 [Mycobacterium sp. E2462]
MVSPKTEVPWRLRYAFGVTLCLLAAVNALIGSAWYLSLGTAVAGIGIIYGGRRRVFHVGVRRVGYEVVCRYVPWYESNPYFATVLLPLMAVGMVGAGCSPAYPAWLLFGGIALLGISALMVAVVVWIWRRSLLRITPTTLIVRTADRSSALTGIRREDVRSIKLQLADVAAGRKSPQVEIVHRPPDTPGSTDATLLIGLYLTVQPLNLFNALVAWRDGAFDDPVELSDRIEKILRGKSTAAA